MIENEEATYDAFGAMKLLLILLGITIAVMVAIYLGMHGAAFRNSIP